MKLTDLKIIVILIVSFIAGIWVADIFFNGFRNPFGQNKPAGQEEQARSERNDSPVPSGLEPGQTDNVAQNTSAPAPGASPKPEDTEKTPKQTLAEKDVLLAVPFTSQSPFKDWKDPRQQDGCEEASAIMAMAWVKGSTLTKEGSLKEIFAISDYEQKTYGSYHDTNAEDTAKRIFKEYFKYDKVEVRHGIGISDIKQELFKGNLIVVPVNGIKLGNPHYTSPGPARHMLVIRGYDVTKKEFITNDPGTTYGEKFRYKEDVLEEALFDYPTGFHEPATETKTAMIVVKKQ